MGSRALGEATEVTSARYSCVLFSETFVLESQNPVLGRRYERWPYFGEANQVEKKHGKSRCQFQALGLFLTGIDIWMNEQLNYLDLHFESLLVLETAEITESIPNLFTHDICQCNRHFSLVCFCLPLSEWISLCRSVWLQTHDHPDSAFWTIEL